jgi:ribosomal protein S13
MTVGVLKKVTNMSLLEIARVNRIKALESIRHDQNNMDRGQRRQRQTMKRQVWFMSSRHSFDGFAGTAS